MSKKMSPQHQLGSPSQDATTIGAVTNLLATDQPISKPSQDSLKRAEFASLTAQALQRNPLHDSLIVGLLGRWGSGKTSLLNLIQYYLLAEDAQGVIRQPNDIRPIVVRFNPWLFADQHQLSSRFFQSLSVAFQTERDKGIRAIGRRIDIERAAQLADAIDDYAKILEPLHIFGPIGDIAIRGGGFWSSLLKRKVKRFGNLDALKAYINDGLTAINRQLVVMIDDIDRLNASEIAQVFQLARLMGDFINTSYILAFDRKLVAGVLEAVQKINGNEYLEKIVQISLDVPAIPRRELHAAAEDALWSLIRERQQSPPNEFRFKSVFEYASANFLKTPRNASKLFSTYRFHLVLLEQERDAVDLLGVTVLQVFLPDLYEAVRDKIERFLIADVSDVPSVNSVTVDEEDRAFISELIKAGSAGVPQDETEAFIGLLFPRAGGLLQKISPLDRSLVDLKRRRGIGHKDYADAYFAFALPPTEFSERSWDELLKELALDDEKTAIDQIADKFLLRIAANDPISLFDKIRDALSETPTGANQSVEMWRRLARLLWVIGDRIVFQTEDVDRQSEIENELLSAIESLLIAHGDDNMRHAVLQPSYNRNHPDHIPPRGLYIPMLLLTRMRCERGLPSELGKYRYPVIANRHVIGSKGHFDEIEGHARTLAQRWVMENNSIDPRALIDVLAAICDLNSRRSAALYLNRLNDTENRFSDFLIAFVVADARYSRLDARDAVIAFLQQFTEGSGGDRVSFDVLLSHSVPDSELEKLRRHIGQTLTGNGEQ